MNKISIAIFMMAISLTAGAQSGTNSPYSQYGFGQLSDNSTGFNRGMNGLSQGYRDGKQLNYQNPASYSSLDSLTFIFDIGMSGQLTSFKENGVRKNVKNATFEYAVAGFRAAKHLGVSFGLMPFSRMGYSFSGTGYLDLEKTESYVNSYSGDGGFHQVYVGVGWEPFKNLSIGANMNYLWGNYSRLISSVYSSSASTTSTVNSLYKTYKASVSNYKLDLGAQWTKGINKNDQLTLGVSYTMGHKLNADSECQIYSVNNSSGVKDTTSFTINNGMELPTMINAGAMWEHKNQLRVGVDYSFQAWGDTKFPDTQTSSSKQSYSLNDNYFQNRHKFTLGGEWCKNALSRNFFDRIRYRGGVSYSTPYLNINGTDGPKELSVSAGFGIPIINTYNNRSLLNISGQWVRQSGKGLIEDNTFRINVGITFNERWFMKFKVQ